MICKYYYPTGNCWGQKNAPRVKCKGKPDCCEINLSRDELLKVPVKSISTKIDGFSVTLDKDVYEESWETLEKFTKMVMNITATVMVQNGMANNIKEAYEFLMEEGNEY